MVIEVRKLGIDAKQQEKINVYYKDHIVGKYKADILVIGKVIVELKAIDTNHLKFEAQLVNYLKANDI